MSRAYRVLRVFAASPSDVAEERERLHQVIEELNLTWSSFLSVHLELIRWETHGFPGFGADAQDVLNEEFADDYDIFVGMMWRRFGTPTGRAGSGTQEEFSRAYARWKLDPKAVSIMFYFRRMTDAEIAVTSPQATLVRDFQNELGRMGGLWWEFSSVDEFASLVRLHLCRQVQVRLRPEVALMRNPAKEAETDSVQPPTTHEDVGEQQARDNELRHLLRQFATHFSASRIALLDVVKETQEIATFRLQNEMAFQIVNGRQQTFTRQECRHFTRELAAANSLFKERSVRALSKFRTLLGQSLKALSHAAPLLLEHSQTTAKTAGAYRGFLTEFVTLLDQGIPMIFRFIESIETTIQSAPDVLADVPSELSTAARQFMRTEIDILNTHSREMIRARAYAVEAIAALRGAHDAPTSS